jgi:hypothetical protein
MEGNQISEKEDFIIRTFSQWVCAGYIGSTVCISFDKCQIIYSYHRYVWGTMYEYMHTKFTDIICRYISTTLSLYFRMYMYDIDNIHRDRDTYVCMVCKICYRMYHMYILGMDPSCQLLSIQLWRSQLRSVSEVTRHSDWRVSPRQAASKKWFLLRVRKSSLKIDQRWVLY